ncbi:hypothetical protein [Draconibacterium halophilum]|uniref:Uncharacterized protein n=1 Tax=Draconibacterium halophilum TaxID=2706887 RepID=A0A6C0RFH3_9BACT|nr:hypothetical protein [Draconibacterium halophilum]QIA08716.1 hypothetical protein G0Q07_13740 [Draconibacterium halophilum]
MKNFKHSIGAVVIVVILLTTIVLLFPLAFDNQKVYSIIVYASIAIFILLLLLLIYINLFSLQHKKH